MNYPKYLKELNELENLSNNVPNSNKREFMQIKRKMKFNLIRNAYDKKINKSTAISSEKNSRNGEYTPCSIKT